MQDQKRHSPWDEGEGRDGLFTCRWRYGAECRSAGMLHSAGFADRTICLRNLSTGRRGIGCPCAGSEPLKQSPLGRAGSGVLRPKPGLGASLENRATLWNGRGKSTAPSGAYRGLGSDPFRDMDAWARLSVSSFGQGQAFCGPSSHG